MALMIHIFFLVLAGTTLGKYGPDHSNYHPYNKSIYIFPSQQDEDEDKTKFFSKILKNQTPWNTSLSFFFHQKAITVIFNKGGYPLSLSHSLQLQAFSSGAEMFLLAKAPRCNSKIEEEMERVKTSGGGGGDREEKKPARKHCEIDGSQSPTLW